MFQMSKGEFDFFLAVFINILPFGASIDSFKLFFNFLVIQTNNLSPKLRSCTNTIVRTLLTIFYSCPVLFSMHFLKITRTFQTFTLRTYIFVFFFVINKTFFVKFFYGVFVVFFLSLSCAGNNNFNILVYLF